MLDTNGIHIDISLVRKLIATQFPQWRDLPIKAIEFGGWDNRAFHLGKHMLIRLPSATLGQQVTSKPPLRNTPPYFKDGLTYAIVSF